MLKKRMQAELFITCMLVTFVIAWKMPMHVYAAESGFTHAHQNSCYAEGTSTCEKYHYKMYNEETQFRNCTACNMGTTHKLTATTYTCQVQNDTWQPDGKCICTVCGKTTTWVNSPTKSHTTKVRYVACGMEEGESTATLQLSADTAWTNKSVTIQAGVNVVKNDASSSGITLSWPDGKMVAQENGTYTVTATNSLGQSISASVTVSCIDKTAPVIGSVNGNTETMTKKEITVSFSASDAESGLAEAPYSTDGGSSWSGNNSFTLTEGSPVTITVRDKAGNTASKTVKRSDFPYPKEPEKPISGETGGSTTVTKNQSGSSAGGSGTEGSGQNASASGNTSGNAESSADAPKDKEDANNSGNASVDNSGKKDTSQDKKKSENKNDGKTDSSKSKEEIKDGEEDGETEEKDMPDIYFSVFRNPDLEIGKDDGREKDAEVLTEASAQSGANAAKKSGGFLGYIAALFAENPMQAGAGAMLLAAAVFFGLFAWGRSVDVYCYEGGDSYEKVGRVFVKKNAGNYQISLPEDMTGEKSMLRYRLVFKKNFARKCEGCDITILTHDGKVRQTMEECMDFAL